MPEQPQWSERTLDMPPQDPWADAPTTPEPYSNGVFDTGTIPDGYRETVRQQRPQQSPDTVRQPREQAPQSAQNRTKPFNAPQSSPPSTTPQAYSAPAPDSPFSQGRAQVKAQEPARQQRFADHDPTGTGWPGAQTPVPQASWRWADLRRGGEWSTVGFLFAFVCWGIWAISGGGPLATPIIVYIVTMLVAVGVFCLARFVGHLIFERQLRRVRHTARGSHMVNALYLFAVGIAFLAEIPWVVDAFTWVKGSF